MEKPATTEIIQLIAVLRVLHLSQDAVSSTLKIRKEIVGKTEAWLREEDIQSVSNILNNEVLKTTIVRELSSYEEVDRNILVKATDVRSSAVLLHYGRRVPEDNLEEKLRQHKNDLAKAADKLIETLNIFETLEVDDYTSLSDVVLMYNDARIRTVLENQLIIGLFRHLKEDMVELKPLSYWGDFTKKHITYALKKKISVKAARRDFIGKCEMCPTSK